MVPEVSIIITNYNYGKYISRCLRSCLKQERVLYEVIVVDACSTDNSFEMIRPFAEQIRFLKTEKNSGVAAAANLGIQNARGQFFFRVDADDYVHAEYLKVLSEFLEQNKYMDAVACDYLLVDDEEKVLSRCNCLSEPIGCGIMFRIENLIEIGLYDDEFLMHEDKELMLRFEKKYKVHRIELPLYRLS